MNTEMFCFQCEQTAKGTGCTGAAGVCGKKSATAKLQDALTGALIALGQSVAKKGATPDSALARLVMQGLFTTVTNVSFDDASVTELTDKVLAEAKKLDAGAQAYDMAKIWDAQEDIRSLKSLVLFGVRGVAAYAWHAAMLGQEDAAVNAFFFKALNALGDDAAGMDELLPVVLETGEKNLVCMGLLDKANTDAYGHPEPTQVSFKVEKGPFIVVTGHDLHDLKLLLEQTQGKGINIYTHGEMLPAHAYPELKKYAHLKGNFGTAWQNQQKEFDSLPAPILWTTNCLMPPKASYADRVFTTDCVRFPGATHIGDNKDFTPVIEAAKRLGGFAEDREFTGMNGGTGTTTGFARNAVLSVADKVIAAVKEGKIKHFFLVGGCDGTKGARSYYRDFVQATPKDTVVLTLACGKYRFNDLDLGDIGGIPRLLDMGQCNDAYSAIQVAVALAGAFNCGVNELPLSLVLSWYEQKAVCILLTLLHLGIKNILLGPSLPAFVSPNVLQFLIEKFNIGAISTPEADLAKCLGPKA